MRFAVPVVVGKTAAKRLSAPRRRRFEAEMSDELAFHIEAYIGDLVRSGVDPAEAPRRARIEFGAIEAAKDQCRQAWGLQLADEFRADLRYTFRASARIRSLLGSRSSPWPSESAPGRASRRRERQMFHSFQVPRGNSC